MRGGVCPGADEAREPRVRAAAAPLPDADSRADPSGACVFWTFLPLKDFIYSCDSERESEGGTEGQSTGRGAAERGGRRLPAEQGARRGAPSRDPAPWPEPKADAPHLSRAPRRRPRTRLEQAGM